MEKHILFSLFIDITHFDQTIFQKLISQWLVDEQLIKNYIIFAMNVLLLFYFSYL